MVNLVYKYLENSPKWFRVVATKTTVDEDGNKIGGYFKPLGEGNGSKENPVGEIALAQFDGGSIIHEGLHGLDFWINGYDAYNKNRGYTNCEAFAYYGQALAGFKPSWISDRIWHLLASENALQRESGWMQLNERIGVFYKNKIVHE